MRVAIHVFDGMSLFHLAAPQLVFTTAAARVPNSDAWSVTLWSTTGDCVRTAEGQQLSGIASPSVVDAADVVIVASWPDTIPMIDDELRTILLTAHARGATIAGLCLGAIAVADTGLLDGRAAVTHWQAGELLAGRGNCRFDDSVLYIDHGDVITSAGTVASIDACLHIVRARCGTEIANTVARNLVVAPHREGGQAQYIEHPVPEHDSETTMSAVLEWAIAHIQTDLSVERLAEHARMSRRTFIRRFRDATGTTPARWVLQQRLAHARQLLESTDWALRRIAHDSGFASDVTLRQNFVAEYTLSPSAYRRQFAATDG